MDTSRIIRIFFIAFFALDVFLFSLYKTGNISMDALSGNGTLSIETRFKRDGITSIPLDDKHLHGFYLSGVETDFSKELSELKKNQSESDFLKNKMEADNTSISVAFSKQSLVQEKKEKDTVSAFLQSGDHLLYGKNYTVLADFSLRGKEKQKIYLSQSYKGLPFIDPSSLVQVDIQKKEKNWAITGYEQTHLKQIEPLREKQELVSMKDVVTFLYNNSKIPEKSKIVFADVGYEKIVIIKQKYVFVPVWFIGIETDGVLSVARVNAITNALVTTTNSLMNFQ